MDLVRLKKDVYVNPEKIVSVDLVDDRVVVYLSNGRCVVMPTSDLDETLKLLLGP